MSARKVRFNADDQSSTTGSSHSSGSQYADARYNVVALQDALTKTLQQLDDCRALAHRYKEDASTAKARVSALENTVSTLTSDNKDQDRQIKDLRLKNDALKKKLRDRQDATPSEAPPSSPARSKKPREKHPGADELEKDRLKERFDRSPPSSTVTSGSSNNKPPSSAKPPAHQRRLSVTAERPLYLEPYGSSAPTSSRRPATGQQYMQQESVPQYSSSRPARGTVEVPFYEDGNYHCHPLPDPRRSY